MDDVLFVMGVSRISKLKFQEPFYLIKAYSVIERSINQKVGCCATRWGI